MGSECFCSCVQVWDTPELFFISVEDSKKRGLTSTCRRLMSCFWARHCLDVTWHVGVLSVCFMLPSSPALPCETKSRPLSKLGGIKASGLTSTLPSAQQSNKDPYQVSPLFVLRIPLIWTNTRPIAHEPFLAFVCDLLSSRWRADS